MMSDAFWFCAQECERGIAVMLVRSPTRFYVRVIVKSHGGLKILKCSSKNPAQFVLANFAIPILPKHKTNKLL
jgi:hypothetical protein